MSISFAMFEGENTKKKVKRTQNNQKTHRNKKREKKNKGKKQKHTRIIIMTMTR